MNFETKSDVLRWYERQERSVTPQFISSIPWHLVRDYPLNPRFVPVLLYMRDVESLTDMYYRELRRTPTGRDPYISKFMERWSIEEITHAELLNRFLLEAGVDTSEDWRGDIQRSVPRAYRATTYLTTTLTKLVGRSFTASHMTFGAIHEVSTTQGYRRLITLADHPVLSQILRAIIREEAAHTQFYWSVARLELKKNDLARRIARFVVDHFWAPVGQGSIPKERTRYTIGTLFGDEEGLPTVDKIITGRIRQLPGFADISKINETAAYISRQMFGVDGPADAGTYVNA